MGWFWADAPSKASPIILKDAPHPPPQAGAVPPPACPMHNTSTDTPSFPPRQTSNPPPSSCPVKSPSHSEHYPPSSQQQPQSALSKLNPLNYMPTLTNAPEQPQTHALPLEKEISSIPRGDTNANWEYPSPQQMYNAMLRKQKPGSEEIDVTAVESMVAVHNFLNEGAWDEIVTWENIFSQGLMKGWERCQSGEQGILREKARQEFMRARREALGVKATAQNAENEPAPEPKLLRFQGRPGEPTPKSRMLQTLAYVFPNSFGGEKPFDRHDWYVARRHADGSVKEVRYVIDYYGGGLQATGEPVFYLDIRPAIDRPSAAAERLIRWGGDVWWRASGGVVREQEAREKEMAKASAKMSEGK